MSTCPTCRKQFDEGVGQCPDDGAPHIDDAVMEAAGIVDETLARGMEVGEYRIEQKIGQGAYGAVYSAEHPLIGKRAAIKVLHRKFSSEIQIVSRFISEARAVNRIRHRNIIDVFSFGRLPDQRQYLIMELLHGQTLRQVLDVRGRLGMVDAPPIS